MKQVRANFAIWGDNIIFDSSLINSSVQHFLRQKDFSYSKSRGSNETAYFINSQGDAWPYIQVFDNLTGVNEFRNLLGVDNNIYSPLVFKQKRCGNMRYSFADLLTLTQMYNELMIPNKEISRDFPGAKGYSFVLSDGNIAVAQKNGTPSMEDLTSKFKV